MKIHQDELCVDLLQQPLHQQKGIVWPEGHVAAADQIYHGEGADLGVVDPDAPARVEGGIVGGTENKAAAVQIVRDHLLVVAVVAQGDDVGACVEQLLRLPGRDAHAGGVFPVDHAEINAAFPADCVQPLLQILQAGRAAHVSHREYPEFHRILPPLFRWVYYRCPGGKMQRLFPHENRLKIRSLTFNKMFTDFGIPAV